MGVDDHPGEGGAAMLHMVPFNLITTSPMGRIMTKALPY